MPVGTDANQQTRQAGSSRWPIAAANFRAMNISSKKPVTLSHYEVLALEAIRTITAALDTALDLEALASPACMAPLHFHRVFRGLCGETPLQMHRRLRLERAAWRLADGKDSVLRVALDAGYETHEAFTRAFRAAFGRTPTEYRVLASPRERKPIASEAGARKTLAWINARAETTVQGHGLRATFASIAEELVSGGALKRMLNHAAGGDATLGHYVGKSEAQLRAAWQTVADFIETAAAAMEDPKTPPPILTSGHHSRPRRTKSSTQSRAVISAAQ